MAMFKMRGITGLVLIWSVDPKVSRPSNLLRCWCSSYYSVSAHALQSGALWPLRLVLYLVTSFFCPFKQSSGHKPWEETHPTPIFCWLRTEWRMTIELPPLFLLRRPQSVPLDHFTCKSRLTVYKRELLLITTSVWFPYIWSSFFSVMITFHPPSSFFSALKFKTASKNS